MIEIKDKKECCGCGACSSICPKNCITMKSDIEGFLYPNVDMSGCVGCDLCEKVCPIIHKKTEDDMSSMEAYVVRTKKDDVLKESTSGGFFSVLSEYVLRKKGTAYGVIVDDENNIIHAGCNNANMEILKKFSGSKYVQTNAGTCFREIKDKLELDELVCFSGTPCQVAGLKGYLGKEYDNLITVDLICHGTPSQKLWKKYVEYQEKKYHSKIDYINFRNKTYGYHSGTMKIEFENGKTYYASGRIDPMLKSFYKDISSRPSCYSCAFKTVSHVSEFTMFDCWSASNLVTGLKDDDKVYTNVFIQNARGKKLWNEIKDNYIYHKADVKAMIERDGCMVKNSSHLHPRRKDFYNTLDQDDFMEHIQAFIPISIKDRLVEKSKALFYRTGTIFVLKRIKRSISKKLS